eukprot:3475096-Rhodomonas_salina.2
MTRVEARYHLKLCSVLGPNHVQPGVDLSCQKITLSVPGTAKDAHMCLAKVQGLSTCFFPHVFPPSLQPQSLFLQLFPLTVVRRLLAQVCGVQLFPPDLGLGQQFPSTGHLLQQRRELVLDDCSSHLMSTSPLSGDDPGAEMQMRASPPNSACRFCLTHSATTGLTSSYRLSTRASELESASARSASASTSFNAAARTAVVAPRRCVQMPYSHSRTHASRFAVSSSPFARSSTRRTLVGRSAHAVSAQLEAHISVEDPL